MANQFLVEIHDYITRHMASDLKERGDAQGRGDEKRFAFIEGHLFELRLIREFLSERFDLTTQKYY